MQKILNFINKFIDEFSQISNNSYGFSSIKDKFTDFIIRKLFSFEIASESPYIIGYLIIKIMENLKKNTDLQNIDFLSKLPISDKIYIITIKELLKLYFIPFIDKIGSKYNTKEISAAQLIFCEQLLIPEILEKYKDRFKYFINAILSTFQAKSQKTRDTAFNNLFTVKISDIEFLRKCLIQYLNKNLGAGDIELADILPLVQNSLSYESLGYLIVQIQSNEKLINTEKPHNLPGSSEKINITDELKLEKPSQIIENSDEALNLILADCKQKYNINTKESIGKLVRIKMSELAVENIEISECSKNFDNEIIDNLLKLKENLKFYITQNTDDFPEISEKDILNITELSNKIKRNMKIIQKYSDLIFRYKETRSTIQFLIDKIHK